MIASASRQPRFSRRVLRQILAATAPVLLMTGLVTLRGDGLAASRTNHLDFKKKLPHYTGKAVRQPAACSLDLRVGATLGDLTRDPELGGLLDAFLGECRSFLGELGISRDLRMPEQADRRDLPAIYVGHPDGFWAPTDRWSDDDLQPYGRHVVAIAVSDPPSRLSKALVAALADSGTTHVLYVRLELSDYAVAQTSWKGSKAVELGTGHTVPVPWLTSLDQLAEVLQFTGVMYRADGGFVRAGAEAFHAQRTPFRQAMLNVQRAIRPADIESALRATRGDLPDAPLAWKVALANLVGQLTGRGDLITPERR